jgi:hypothetical protein
MAAASASDVNVPPLTKPKRTVRKPERMRSLAFKVTEERVYHTTVVTEGATKVIERYLKVCGTGARQDACRAPAFALRMQGPKVETEGGAREERIHLPTS